MDKGEHDHANALDFHHDVLVFLYPFYEAFISLKLAVSYQNSVLRLKISFIENLAFGRVDSCQEL